MKICNSCNIKMSTSLFSKNSRNKDGYQSNCKLCSIEKMRLWRMNNSEKAKMWRDNNKDKTNLATSKWRKLNPDKVLERKRRRKAARLGNDFEPYSDAQVVKVYGTDCHICLLPIDMQAPRKAGMPRWELGLHIDHIIPISKKGPDTLENVRPSHGLCNLKKSDSII